VVAVVAVLGPVTPVLAAVAHILLSVALSALVLGVHSVLPPVTLVLGSVPSVLSNVGLAGGVWVTGTLGLWTSGSRSLHRGFLTVAGEGLGARWALASSLAFAASALLGGLELVALSSQLGALLGCHLWPLVGSLRALLLQGVSAAGCCVGLGEGKKKEDGVHGGGSVIGFTSTDGGPCRFFEVFTLLKTP
jgi:hypothetical protein